MKTIESVKNQKFQNFEFILIDGDSVDNSLQIIKDNYCHFKYWISEPDSGIYNAMNKGIIQAKGDYCLFLNSGDWLKSENSLEEFFSHNPQADIVSGDIIFYDTVNKNIKWVIKAPHELTAKTLFLGTLPHQATLVKRTLFHDYGFYREDLKIVSDWYFFLEVLLNRNCSYQHIPVTLSYFAMDGISCSPLNEGLPRNEQYKVLIEKYPRFIQDYEQMRHLENSQNLWIESREFRVYNKLLRLGIINLGIQFIRIKDFIFRYFKPKD